MTARPPGPPRLRTRAFDARDADAVAALFTAYMAELFAQPNAMTPDILRRDGQGRRFQLCWRSTATTVRSVSRPGA